jgi:hypothetical protein
LRVQHVVDVRTKVVLGCHQHKEHNSASGTVHKHEQQHIISMSNSTRDSS